MSGEAKVARLELRIEQLEQVFRKGKESGPVLTDSQMEEMRSASKPLSHWLAKNCNPHCEITITQFYAILSESIVSVAQDELEMLQDAPRELGPSNEVPGLKELEGEYAGIIFGKDGEQDYRLILLPGEIEKVDWKTAMDWAVRIKGGELPTRREQSLLSANIKEQFKAAWYWSCEQASHSDYAWGQYFYTSAQNYYHKNNEFLARAVRRVAI